MRPSDRLFGAVVEHRRVLLVVLLVGLVTVSAGLVHLEDASGIEEFGLGTEEEAQLEYVETNFAAHGGDRVVAQVIVRDEDTLDRETLIATLELQQGIREDERIEPTLDEDQPTAGLANVVARAALEREHGITDPTLDQQIEALRAMDQSEIDAILERVLAEDGSAEALAFVPADHEPGSTNSPSTMVVVFQTHEGEFAPADAPEVIVDSHLAIQEQADAHLTTREQADAHHATREQADAHHDDVAVVADGLVTDEERRALGDTMGLVGPAALLLVLVVLVIAYRDVLDVALGLAGIVLVQLWTFGTLGWLGLAFNPVLVAVPVLLIGLSIDYCIHVFMRYREHRADGTGGDDGEDGAGIDASMKAGLAGVGVALVWVTLTTAIGFLSNLTSPLDPVGELGLIAAIGIVGAFVVFGLFVPLVKVELDRGLERLGIDRTAPPIGAGDGVVARILSVGSTAARTAPVAVVVLTLVLTAGTTMAATNVDTTWGPEDNMVEGAPEWTENLPAGVQPGEYEVRENIEYANDNYVRHGSEVEIVVEGDVTDPATLQRLERAENRAADQDAVVLLADGEPRVASPLSTIREVAREDEAFAETVDDADTTGDGVPDEDLATVFDHLFEVAPERADEVLHREDGAYVAYRLSVSVDPGAEGTEPADQLEPAAAELDDEGVAVTVTGRPVVEGIIQETLQETLLVSFAVTLLAVVGVLAALFRVVQGSATLGVVTILPVVAATSWVLATMYALGYPLSVLNVIVASLTIGIGIDYSIHVTERFRGELDSSNGVGEAVTTTVRGTGAALLGSASTTAAGFGVLALAIHPPLQQFGTITAIMIGYAFLASVLVLPSLLVLWARFAGVDTASDASRSPPETESADGRP